MGCGQNKVWPAGEELTEDVDGGDSHLPVGDAKVTQVGTCMAGQSRSGVEAGTAELASHHTEGIWVEVGN